VSLPITFQHDLMLKSIPSKLQQQAHKVNIIKKVLFLLEPKRRSPLEERLRQYQLFSRRAGDL
jgi:hypothetical protein